MKTRTAMQYLTSAAALAALFTLTLASAHATPAGAGVADLTAQFRAGTAVEQAAYRCRWRDGERRCRWIPDDEYYDRGPDDSYYYGPGYRYYSGPVRPEAYPTGSAEWWRAMEAWGRTGGGRR